MERPLEQKIFYYSEQTLIVVLHFILLGWMIYTLAEGGTLTFNEILLHFTGMAVYGGLLIRLTAYLTKRRMKQDESFHS